jgi:small GTP-binding protein
MDKIKKELECDYTFKIIFLGNQGVGKTSIVRRLRDKGFKYKAQPTIGLDFTSLHANITHGKKVKFHIWDTAGQENFQSIIRSYYRGVACACIVIDVSEQNAFDNASKWLKEYNTLKSPDSVGMPVIIGNKTDLTREYTYEEGERWANENGCMYWEMSAKNNDNTSGLLYFVGNNIFNNWDGESKVVGILNNKLKEKIEMTAIHRDNFVKTCCSIV